MFDVGRAIIYPFRSHAWWKTMLFGSVVAAIPYVGPWLVFAHLLPITEQVAEGDEEQLPGFALLPLLPSTFAGIVAICFWTLFVGLIAMLVIAIPIHLVAIVFWMLIDDWVLSAGIIAHGTAIVAIILLGIALQQI